MLATLFGTVPVRRASSEGDESQWMPVGTGGVGYLGRRVTTLAGPRVDEDSALTLSGVWCATRILCEAVGGLPLLTYRRAADDGREPATDLSVFDLLKTAPNPEMDSVVFREGRTGHQVNAGNGFAEIERNPATGEPVALWPIHWCRVRPTHKIDQVDATKYPYLVANNDGTFVAMRRDELLHVPGVFSEDGVWGKGTIAYARESIGGSQAAEQHGYAYFGSGNQPKAVLTMPGMKDPEARRNYRKEWRELHAANTGEIAIIPVEAKYQQISISNQDSQFLESRKFNVTEIARWYRVPAHMIGEFEKAAAYASVEAQGIEFVIYSLLPWLRKWEGQCNLKLLTKEQRPTCFIEHVLDGLIRGDKKTRMESYRTALQIGIMSINECRRLENMPGIGPAGDVYYVPMNMTTAERMMEGDVPQASAGGRPSPFDEPKGGTEGAFDDWTRKAAEQLLAAQNGTARRVQGRTVPQLPDRPAETDSAALAAAYKVLADAVGRMAHREATAAERAAKGDWDQWVAEFWPKHQEQVAKAVGPACEMLSALGDVQDAAVVAGRLCVCGRDGLSAAYDTQTPEQFAATLGGWATSRVGDIHAV